MSTRLEDLLVAAAMSTVLASGHLPGRAGRLVRGLLGGLWLGLLDEHALKALDERYYERDATYRSDAWNRRGLSAWERDAVSESFRPGARIIVASCGGGREVLGLLDQGYDAVGYEPHPELAAYAQRFLTASGHPDRAWPVPRDTFPAEPCDGALVGWGGYSLISPAAKRIAFLRGAAAVLRPRARLVLSCFEQVGESRELRLVSVLAGVLRRLRRATAPEPGDAMAPNRVHVFSRERLLSELDEAGFTVDALRELEHVDAHIRYVCVTAHRR